MDTDIILWILGGAGAIVSGMFASIKSDLSKMMRMFQEHGHKIECEANDCKPKTSGVLIHD